MSYNEEGTVEVSGPYFAVEKFPFIIPKEDLVDNYPAVLRVMKSTAKRKTSHGGKFTRLR